MDMTPVFVSQVLLFFKRRGMPRPAFAYDHEAGRDAVLRFALTIMLVAGFVAVLDLLSAFPITNA